MSDTSAPKPRLHPGFLWGGLIIGLSAILIGLLSLFILPSLHSGARDVALGIVAEQQTTDTIEQTLTAEAPDAFDLASYGSADDLARAIEEREVSGGFVIDASGMQVLTASAGSTAVSATISATGTAIAANLGVEAQVTDVVPLPDADPSGVGIGGLAFPLVFGGIVPAVAFRSLLPGRRAWILSGLLGFSAVGGLIVAGVLAFIFGSIATSAIVPVAGGVALGIAALALPLAGLFECFGGKGFTIAAMLMMFVGNPFAGISTGAQWLPAGVGLIGQLLPPGAAGTLVRSLAYFGGAGGGAAALTLSIWVIAGLALWFAGPAIRRAKATAAVIEADAAEPVAAA
ncbi:hypothetical protein [uncultured Microbacterium sp.]|uniref:hypothetical protein n=1 Tax=uncultured Microbacterium sp. TaxID=191216 RepID=UPI00260C2959|nr:hypothetical protein [uncultured Microbacterium sp.]